MLNSKLQRSPSRAFTLIEASVSTIIVGVMVAASLSVVGTAAKGATREREWRQSKCLAQALLAEALAGAFSDPQGGTTFGLEANENAAKRTTYDDIDDFDGYTDSPATDADGNKLTWSNGWVRAVQVHNVQIADPTKAESDSTDTGLRRVTVTVTAPSGQARTMVALKARASILDAYPLEVSVNRITGTRIAIRVGRSGSVLVGGATTYNAPSSKLATAPVP